MPKTFRVVADKLGRSSARGGGRPALVEALDSRTLFSAHLHAGLALQTPSAITPAAIVADATGSTLTSVAVRSSNSILAQGQALTFTATVTPVAQGGVALTGTVSFLAGSTVLGSGTLNGSDVATFTSSSLAPGNYSIVAQYSGDTNFAPSASSSIPQTITANPTVTVFASSPQIFAGQSVTFTVTVAPASGSGQTPTGSVAILDGGSSLGVIALQPNGSASFSTINLLQGSHSITATYSGDTIYAPGMSPAITEPVTASSTQLNYLQQPTGVMAAGTISPPVTVAIENPLGQTVAADGSNVTLAIAAGPAGATLLGTATVAADNGVATFNDLSLPSAGVYTLVATDGSLAVATSLPFTIHALTPTAALTPAITRSTLSDSFVAGAAVHGVVSITLANNTQAAVTETATVKIFASASGVVDESSVLLASKALHKAFKLGKAFGVNAPIKIPPSLAAGSYALLAEVVDPLGTATALLGGSAITVGPPIVTLTARIVSVKPSSIKAGKLASLIVSLSNSGNTSATGTAQIHLGLSVDGSTEAIPLVNLAAPAKVKKEGASVLHLHVLIPAGTAAGSYFPDITLSEDGSATTAFGTVGFAVHV